MSVVITGIGLVTPLGQTVADLWTALLAGQTAARVWPDLAAAGYRIPIACRIPELVTDPCERGATMALLAAKQAVAHAQLATDAGAIGVFVGTTMAESRRFEEAAEGQHLDLAQAIASAYPRKIRQALGITGPARAYATACAAGNYAIGAAADAVRTGRLRAAIAGGVEPFSRIALVGFSRSRAMADDLCRPFDAQRRGMQLGEAAAFVVLEEQAAAIARGITPVAAVETLGLSCDAYHPIAPRADGAGMIAAMQDALGSGHVPPEAIGLICAHGTGTISSDAAEAQALATLFPHRPVVFAPKGALGHSLGAATAVQVVLTALALYHQIAPPTANVRTVDPACTINVVTEPTPLTNVHYALNCGYAFGGINSALLLQRLAR